MDQLLYKIKVIYLVDFNTCSKYINSHNLSSILGTQHAAVYTVQILVQ